MKFPLVDKFNLQSYLFSRLKREAQAELNPRRIYILPSREGVIYTIILLLLLAGALNYNNGLLFFFTFLLVAMGVIAMHHTHNNLLHIIVRAADAKAVFAGEALHIPVHFSLKKDQTKTRYSLHCKLHGDQDGALAQDYSFDINSDETTTLCFILTTYQRGYVEVPKLTLYSLYPLGLLRAWANLLLDKQYLVYPQPMDLAELKLIQTTAEEGSGDKGKGYDEFSELREKQISDSFAHVHWKAYARTDELLIKQYGGSLSENIMLSWEEYPQYDTEKRLSLFTRLIMEAENNQQKFGLTLPHQTVALGSGDSHLHHCLKALALFPSESS